LLYYAYIIVKDYYINWLPIEKIKMLNLNT